jgi:DNA-binding Lrp family transcriptional regulator
MRECTGDRSRIRQPARIQGKSEIAQIMEGGLAMAKAYLKISVEAGREKEIRKALQEIPEVTTADLTTGDQDIIAVIEASSYDKLLRTIVEEMRGIEGITSTSTSLVLD